MPAVRNSVGYTMGETGPPGIRGLVFSFGEDGKTLRATFTPPEEKPREPNAAEAKPPEERPPIEVQQIEAALAGGGFGNLFFFERAQFELARRCSVARAPFTFDLGERRDGTVKVTLARGDMLACVTITPPFGGRAVDGAQVRDALQAAGVVSGISPAQIDAAVAPGEVDMAPVASGREPQPGRDTEFHSLIPELKGRHPRVDERGIADYRDLGTFVSVKAGTPLMRRVPPAPGVAGENVLGQAVSPKAGKDVPFTPGLKGAKVDAKDFNLLVAEIAGQAVIVNHGVTVDPVLHVEEVDLTTGNVVFDGSVHVVKDVITGMKIKAVGDVFVGGVVEAADIEAEGNISIRGGVIGHAAVSGRGGPVPTAAAHIRSGGSVTVRFVENAAVSAGNAIFVEEEVNHSALTAVGQVVVGKPGARRGHIMGGTTRATLLVQSLVAGSPAGVETRIEVGTNPVILGALEAVTQRLKKLEHDRHGVAQTLVHARENPAKVDAQTLQEARSAWARLQAQFAECSAERDRLQAQLDLAVSARVVVANKIHGGVHVHIGPKVRHIEDARIGGTFRLENDDIVIGDG